MYMYLLIGILACSLIFSCFLIMFKEVIAIIVTGFAAYCLYQFADQCNHAINDSICLNNKKRCRYKRVYRLLRHNEDVMYGIQAKEPGANVTIDHHVAHGSRSRSQYISTSATIKAIRQLVRLKTTYLQYNFRVVEIDLAEMIRANPYSEIIDLTDGLNAYNYLQSTRARKFAKQFDEVLIKGHIPPSAVRVVFNGNRNEVLWKL